MEITITVSDKVAKVIGEKADDKDMGLADLAGDLLEEKVKEEFPESVEPESVEPEAVVFPHPLLKFAGMFSSGQTDTSERHSEILKDAVKMPGGLGGGD